MPLPPISNNSTGSRIESNTRQPADSLCQSFPTSPFTRLPPPPCGNTAPGREVQPKHPLLHSQEYPTAPVAHLVHGLQGANDQVPHLAFQPISPPSSSSSTSNSRPFTNTPTEPRSAKKIGFRRKDSSARFSGTSSRKLVDQARAVNSIAKSTVDKMPYPYQSLSSYDNRIPPPMPNNYYAASRPQLVYAEPRPQEYRPDPYRAAQPAPVRYAPAIPISGLITPSDEHYQQPQSMNYTPSSYLQQPQPQPLPPALPLLPPRPTHAVLEPEFRMEIRQQPINARACGFGERDRRVIDPPPILEMIPNSTSYKYPGDSRGRYPNGVVHCTLWHAEQDIDDTTMPEAGERKQQRRLMGSLVSSPFIGLDENGNEGCFFTFPDLSVRTAGEYRLRFVLVILNPGEMGPGSKAPFQSVVVSQVFSVYAAKDFPGMRSSTALTKKLKEQGCLISVKKGNDREGKKGGSLEAGSSSDGQDDGDSEDEVSHKPKSKMKTSKDKQKAAKKKRRA